MKKSKHVLVFPTLFIIVFSLFSGLAIFPVQAASIQFTEGQVTSNMAAQVNPDVYGDRIVWQDERNGNWDIYMYAPRVNLWQPEIQITTSQGNDIHPKIFKDIIVYQSDRNGNWDIYIYNITSKVEIQITTDTAMQSNPAIYGNTIVWQDARNAVLDIYYYGGYRGWDIYTHDLTTNLEQRLPLSAIDPEHSLAIEVQNNFNPAISGNRIAYIKEEQWQSSFSGIRYYRPYIYCYDLSTGIESHVAKGSIIDAGRPSNIHSPAIVETQIAWLQSGSVVTKELGVNTQWLGAGNQNLPAIGGVGSYKYVVFDDIRHGDSEIYMYEVASGIENRVTNNLARQTNAAIFSGSYDDRLYNTIVYMDDRNGNWDIYATSFGWIAGNPGTSQEDLLIENIQMFKSNFADPSYIQTSSFDGANNKVKENRRNAIVNQLDSVIESIQSAVNTQNLKNRSKQYQNAIDQLNDLQKKTDGYPLRDTPDVPKSGYTPDWVIDFTAQLYLYQTTSEFLAQLQTMLENIS
jgi:TolB protein